MAAAKCLTAKVQLCIDDFDAASAFFAASDFRLPSRPPALPMTDLELFAVFFAAIASETGVDAGGSWDAFASWF